MQYGCRLNDDLYCVICLFSMQPQMKMRISAAMTRLGYLSAIWRKAAGAARKKHRVRIASAASALRRGMRESSGGGAA